MREIFVSTLMLLAYDVHTIGYGRYARERDSNLHELPDIGVAIEMDSSAVGDALDAGGDGPKCADTLVGECARLGCGGSAEANLIAVNMRGRSACCSCDL